MKKILSLSLIAIMCFGLLVGCSEGIEEPEPITPPIESNQETAPTDGEHTPPEIKEPTIDVSKMTKFDLDLYIFDNAYAESGTNTMYSPLSLDMALGMVAEGAGSEYHNLFPKLLGRENYSEFAGRYLQYVSELNKDVDSEYNKYKTVFEIANSLWVKDEYSLLESYLNKIQEFNPEAKAVDFMDITAVVSEINNWCKAATHDMIDEVVNEDSLNANSAAVLINAIYFESPWREAWNISNKDNVFHGFSEDEEVKMIKTTTNYYYENKHATAFGSTYKNGLIFIGILPKDKGEFLLGDLDIESLLQSETTKYEVNAKMPTFKFDNKISNLKKTLIDAGYGILFDESTGMFTQMLENENGNVELFISDIVQMDAIELDENGTKAAAVTAVIMDANAAITNPPETKDVILNRPFAFLIYDPVMEQIVFMGKVVNPQ